MQSLRYAHPSSLPLIEQTTDFTAAAQTVSQGISLQSAVITMSTWSQICKEACPELQHMQLYLLAVSSVTLFPRVLSPIRHTEVSSCSL